MYVGFFPCRMLRALFNVFWLRVKLNKFVVLLLLNTDIILSVARYVFYLQILAIPAQALEYVRVIISA